MSTAQAISYAFAFVLFIGLYAYLRRRIARETGVDPPIQWKMLAIVIGCSVVAIAIGALLR